MLRLPNLEKSCDYFPFHSVIAAACEEQGQAASLIDGGESTTDFGNYSSVKRNCGELTANAYNQMRIFLQNSTDPEVREEITVKTCRDLFLAHPDEPSGESRLLFMMLRMIKYVLSLSKR